jgi:hypothetical protein
MVKSYNWNRFQYIDFLPLFQGIWKINGDREGLISGTPVQVIAAATH